MKNIVKLAEKCFRKSPGFTLPELLIAMTVGSLIMAGIFAVWIQLFAVTATNSNYMAAFRQVQNGGDWISNDSLMSQQVYCMDTDPSTPDVMDPARLDGGISDTTDIISVDSTASFPPSGVICIGDELIHYTDKTGDAFGTASEPVTRATNAIAHDDGSEVTFFVHLSWTAWSGDQHQVVYSLEDMATGNLKKLQRSETINAGNPAVSMVAECIDPSPAYTSCEFSGGRLTFIVTANVTYSGEEQSESRIFVVLPRPGS